MSCRRAFEIDLAAFLAQPRGAEWADFREHYPLCRECADEVYAWTLLGTELMTEHPSPELWLLWTDAPGSLDAAERARMHRHLERCRTCADELRALDPAGRAHAAEARGGSTSPRQRHPLAARGPAHAPGRRSSPRTMRRVLWNPAFPYAALIALLLLPLVRGEITRRSGRMPETPGGEVDAARSETASSNARVTAAPAEQPPAAPDAALAPAPQGGTAPTREDSPDPAIETEAANFRKSLPGALADAQTRDSDAPAPRRRSAAEPPLAGLASAAAPDAGSPVERTVADPPETRAEVTALRLRWRDAGSKEPRRLIVALPGALRGTPSLRVQIRSGNRALEEQVRLPPGTEEIEIELPPGWLADAPRAVEVHSSSGLVARGEIAAR